jgi:uncharacterized coiled-coil protein SlyX
MNTYHYVIISLDPALLKIAQTFGKTFDVRLTALESTMSTLTDTIAQLKASSVAEDASLDQALTRVQAEVANFSRNQGELQAKIDALQAQVDGGGATPEDIQTLKDLIAQKDSNKAKLDALNPTNPATLDGGSTTPTPPPTPTGTSPPVPPTDGTTPTPVTPPPTDGTTPTPVTPGPTDGTTPPPTPVTPGPTDGTTPPPTVTVPDGTTPPTGTTATPPTPDQPAGGTTPVPPTTPPTPAAAPRRQ